MKKLIILTFIAFLKSGIANDTLRFVENSKVYCDKLGSIYIVTPFNDIEKYNSKKEKLATYNQKVYGNIFSIDVSNPFEIYVFYKDQSIVLFLDNQLNQRGITNLNDIGIQQASAIARSFDNQIWVMDLADLKLKKISKDLKVLTESNVLNSTSIEMPLNLEFLIDNNQHIYTLNQGVIYSFDVFGNFEKRISTDSITQFQILDDVIYYNKNNKIYHIELALPLQIQEPEPLWQTDSKEFQVIPSFLILIHNDLLILQPL